MELPAQSVLVTLRQYCRLLTTEKVEGADGRFYIETVGVGPLDGQPLNMAVGPNMPFA
jgi:hypothetical protein